MSIDDILYSLQSAFPNLVFARSEDSYEITIGFRLGEMSLIMMMNEDYETLKNMIKYMIRKASFQVVEPFKQGLENYLSSKDKLDNFYPNKVLKKNET